MKSEEFEKPFACLHCVTILGTDYTDKINKKYVISV